MQSLTHIIAPILYHRVRTIDLLFVIRGHKNKPVRGCPSKRDMLGMIKYLNLEYPEDYQMGDIELYVKSFSKDERAKIRAGVRGYADEVWNHCIKESIKMMRRALGTKDVRLLLPGLEWLAFGTAGHIQSDEYNRRTAGTAGILDTLAPKHLCVRTVRNYIPRRRNYSAFYPVNISTYLQVGTKEIKAAFDDPPTTTETLNVHFPDDVEFKGIFPLTLPYGITRYLLPLPSKDLDLICTDRAISIGGWIFDLMNPKLFPGDQYSFVFYIQCPPAATPFGQKYRNRMEEVLQEWMVKAREREEGRIARGRYEEDGEWERLEVKWELVDELPWCDGCRR